MINSGIVELPLHSGKCPQWLFPMMKKLAGKISELIVDEYGTEELLKRIADPYWFQAFGCVLGFDWHSSGLTTTTSAALKEAFRERDLGVSLGIGFAGGKGKTGKKTPGEIIQIGDKLGLNEKRKKELVRSSRLSAKVDNYLLQDGFKLYHHSFFFTKKNWIVVQQGMYRNYARRYHWISKENLDFVNEPHNAIVSDKITKPLNLVSKECEETRKCSLDLVKNNPTHLKKYLKIKNRLNDFGEFQTSLDDFKKVGRDGEFFSMSKEHFPKIDFELKSLMKAYEEGLDSYEEFVLTKGIGGKNLRALALISHLIYGTKLCWKDPVRYSFCHGGKDGWPFPVEREEYLKNIGLLEDVIKNARIGNKEKILALKRINKFCLKRFF